MRPDLYGTQGFNFVVALKIFVVVLLIYVLIAQPFIGMLPQVYKPNFVGYSGAGVAVGIIVSAVFLVAYVLMNLFAGASIGTEVAWIFVFTLLGSWFMWLMLKIS